MARNGKASISNTETFDETVDRPDQQKIVDASLKTKKAYRTLPLAEDTIQVLKQQKKKAGSSLWVFPGPTGGPISPDSVLHILHPVLKRAGLPRVRSPRPPAHVRYAGTSEWGGH